MKAVDRPEIRLLVDFSHLAEEGESADILVEAGAQLVHAHIAKHVRMSADNLRVNPVNDLIDIELLLIICNLRLKNNLQ